MIKNSKNHLKEVKESYVQHLLAASKIGLMMILGGIQAIFTCYYSRYLKKISQ